MALPALASRNARQSTPTPCHGMRDDPLNRNPEGISGATGSRGVSGVFTPNFYPRHLSGWRVLTAMGPSWPVRNHAPQLPGVPGGHSIFVVVEEGVDVGARLQLGGDPPRLSLEPFGGVGAGVLLRPVKA